MSDPGPIGPYEPSPREYVDSLAVSSVSTAGSGFMGMTDPTVSNPMLSQGSCMASAAFGNPDSYLDALLQDDVEFSMQLGPSLTQHDPALQQGIEFSWTSSIPYFLPWQPPAPQPQIGASRTASGTKDCLGGLIEIFKDRGLRIEEVISAGVESICRRWVQGPRQESPTLFSAPDPFRNIIQSSRTTTLLGLICNARCIGIRLQDLLTPKYPSPFYDPDKANVDPQALLAAASKPSMPVNLRPTLPQVTFPHPAYLDLLPFPELRARAITLTATMPHIFNPLDLKWDLLEDGLVCGGSENFGSEPWDMRNWEAAPWFLQKWHMLIDGGTGEIRKSKNDLVLPPGPSPVPTLLGNSLAARRKSR